MKKTLLLLILFIAFISLRYADAQTPPANDNCTGAITIKSVSGYCSNPAEYTNVNATAGGLAKAQEWPSVGKDVWFKFIAIAYDVNIDVKTSTGLGTLNRPQVAIYTTNNCMNFNQQIGSFFQATTEGSYYKGGLTVGQTYYVRISGDNNNTGTFQLCLDNYFPPLAPGQDYETASLLCSKEAFTQYNVTGAGLDNREGRGTCMDGFPESNTAWYKWIASNNGTLTFNIIPTDITNDMDWVLFDLGPSDNPKPINASNAIRCASGSGVAPECNPKYYITGLNLTSTDLNEPGGCGLGQDGFVKFIDMQQNHLYALLINNFENANNGFRLEFGGTGEFEGPAPTFKTQNTFCDTQYTTTYTADENRAGHKYLWDFGDDATPKTSTAVGPIQVNYPASGERVVTLQITSPLGCISYRSFFFKDSGPIPDAKIADVPKTYCIGDTLVLTPINRPAGVDAVWTLPNGDEVVSDQLIVPLSSESLSGLYKMRYQSDPCIGTESGISITVLKKPKANFDISPTLDQLYSAPITFNFFNTSKDATGYIWDFGDGTTSALENPSHTYNSPGKYRISLVAYNQQCTDTLKLPILKILAEGEILVPNAFTPNGDGNNDQFNILVSNLKTYHIDIFNRFGSIVFSSDSIIDSWDGTRGGKPMPVGVYYFIINAVDLLGNKLFEKNSVTLIR